jgi:hypothetical protein
MQIDHKPLTLRGGPVGVMLRDRYDLRSLFDAVPRLQLRFEAELAAVDRLLDDDTLFRLVRDDLAWRYPQTTVTGRPSTPIEIEVCPRAAHQTLLHRGTGGSLLRNGRREECT